MYTDGTIRKTVTMVSLNQVMLLYSGPIRQVSLYIKSTAQSQMQ